MKRLPVVPLIRAVERLARYADALDFRIREGREWDLIHDLRATLVAGMEDLSVQAAATDLGEPIAWALDASTKRLRTDLTLTVKQAAMILADARDHVFDGLTRTPFPLIALTRRELYEQAAPPFGTQVHSTYPEADTDLSEAARCMALEQWTAAVFHLMRALEIALRDLALRLAVEDEGTPLDRLNWQTLIERIEKRIRDLGQEPRTSERDVLLKSASETALSLRYFKDAFRNHAMHARVDYDADDAMSIWLHSGTFMRDLARTSASNG